MTGRRPGGPGGLWVSLRASRWTPPGPPRPPALRRCDKRIRVVLQGELLADTTDAWCVLETSHPPTYYLPPADIDMQYLREASGSSFCEWKGVASYYDLVCKERTFTRAAWTYHQPAAGFLELRGHISFYAHVMDACYVGEQRVIPQPGNFYGGWITPDVVGPFKGDPGTSGW